MEGIELVIVVVPQLVAIGAAYGGITARLDAIKETAAAAAQRADQAHNRIDDLLREGSHA